MFGTIDEVIVGEVPCKLSALSSTAGKVYAKEGKVVPPIASEATGGEEALQGTRGSTELAEGSQQEIALLYGKLVDVENITASKRATTVEASRHLIELWV